MLERRPCSVCPGCLFSSSPGSVQGASTTGRKHFSPDPVIATCVPVLEFSKRGSQESCLLVLPSSSCLKLRHSARKPISHLAVSRTKRHSEDGRAERTERPGSLVKSSSSCSHPRRPPPFFSWDGAASLDRHRHTLDWLEPPTAVSWRIWGQKGGETGRKGDETGQPRRPARGWRAERALSSFRMESGEDSEQFQAGKPVGCAARGGVGGWRLQGPCVAW